MNKLVKRLVSGALSLVLVGALSVSAFAAAGDGTGAGGTVGPTDTATGDTITATVNLLEAKDPAFYYSYSWESMSWTYVSYLDSTTGSRVGTWFTDTQFNSASIDANSSYDAIKGAVDPKKTTNDSATGAAAKMDALGKAISVINMNSSPLKVTISDPKINSQDLLKVASHTGTDAYADATLTEGVYAFTVPARQNSDNGTLSIGLYPDTTASFDFVVDSVKQSTITSTITLTFSKAN